MVAIHTTIFSFYFAQIFNTSSQMLGKRLANVRLNVQLLETLIKFVLVIYR